MLVEGSFQEVVGMCRDTGAKMVIRFQQILRLPKNQEVPSWEWFPLQSCKA